MKKVLLLATAALFAGSAVGADPHWRHLSTKNGDLPVPNEGKEQTSSIVLDIDNDGTNDFVITERTKAIGPRTRCGGGKTLTRISTRMCPGNGM
jgi:hypothetical protein